MASSKMLSSGSSDSTPPGVTPCRRRGRSRCFLDEQQLTCPVCLDVIYQVMSVSPCNHKFCASCILQWADENESCPKCRIRMRGVSRDSFAQQIIEQYLENYPDRQRPQARIEAAERLELKYLEKLMNDEEETSDDDDSIIRDMMGENSFDDTDTMPIRRRRVQSPYIRDEYLARIARLQAQGVVATPPRARIRPARPAPQPRVALPPNLRDLRDAIIRHLADPLPQPVIPANRRVVAARAANPPPAPPPPPPPPPHRAPVVPIHRNLAPVARQPVRVPRQPPAVAAPPDPAPAPPPARRRPAPPRNQPPPADDPPPPVEQRQMVTRSQARRLQAGRHQPYPARPRR